MDSLGHLAACSGVQFDIKEASGPKLPPVRTKEEIDNIYVQKVSWQFRDCG